MTQIQTVWENISATISREVKSLPKENSYLDVMASCHQEHKITISVLTQTGLSQDQATFTMAQTLSKMRNAPFSIHAKNAAGIAL